MFDLKKLFRPSASQKPAEVDPAVSALAIPKIGFANRIKEARIPGAPDLEIKNASYDEGCFFVVGQSPLSPRPMLFLTEEDTKAFERAGLKIHQITLTGGSSGSKGTRIVVDPQSLYAAHLQRKVSVGNSSDPKGPAQTIA